MKFKSLLPYDSKIHDLERWKGCLHIFHNLTILDSVVALSTTIGLLDFVIEIGLVLFVETVEIDLVEGILDCRLIRPERSEFSFHV